MNHRVRFRLTGSFRTILGGSLVVFGVTLSQAWAIECGEILEGGSFRLEHDVVCESGDGPAITLRGRTKLDLNGHAVLCNRTGRDGVRLEEENAKVANGIVSDCRNGVRVRGSTHKILWLIVENSERDGVRVDGDQNQIVGVESRNNERRGFRVNGGNENHFVHCLATNNGHQGFKIEAGTGNKIRNSAANHSCRDGIEIEGADENGADENSVINNLVEDNGNQEVCERFSEDYLPQFYAGIDVTQGSQSNTVINNKTSGNLGCVLEPGKETCEARERNLWDENVDGDGVCISTNRWINNRADGSRVLPECTPSPSS